MATLWSEVERNDILGYWSVLLSLKWRIPVLNCKLKWGESVIFYRVNWFFRQHYLRRHISICSVSFLSFKSTQYSLALASKRNDYTLTVVDVSFFSSWFGVYCFRKFKTHGKILFCFAFFEKRFSLEKGTSTFFCFSRLASLSQMHFRVLIPPSVQPPEWVLLDYWSQQPCLAVPGRKEFDQPFSSSLL